MVLQLSLYRETAWLSILGVAMSVEATSWSLHQQAVTDPAARAVLFGLANHANHEGRHAFPSVSLLCRYTGLAPRTVKAKLKLLVDSGLIRRGNQKVAAAIIDRADRRPTVYDLDLTKGLDTTAIGDEERDATPAPRNNKRGAPETPREPNGVHFTAERGARDAPEPSLTNPYSLSGAGEQNVFQQAASSTDDGDPPPARSHRFAMTLDWQPNSEYLATACWRIGLPADTSPEPHQLAKFTAHHADHPERQHGTGNWHAKLADWLRNDLKHAPAQSLGADHANRTGSHSAGRCRDERDAVRQQLADPYDTSWAEDFWEDEPDTSGAQGSNHRPGEQGIYPAGGDFPEDVFECVSDGGHAEAQPPGGGAGAGAVADAAHEPDDRAGVERDQAHGEYLAADDPRVDREASTQRRGCGYAEQR